MQETFLFSGFGGQGVMFAGQLLAYAAMDSQYEVTWIPSYGPEMRGGTAHCTVVISDKPIGSPVISHPKVVIAFNNPSFDKYELLVQSGGVFAYNSSLIDHPHTRTDFTALPIPASELAQELGNMKLLNVVMLGAVLSTSPIISVNAIRHALESHIPQHRRNLLPLNFVALEKGKDYVRKIT